MDNLTLEHLSAYLPYGLEITFEGDEYTHYMVGVEDTTNGIILISPFNHYGRCDISKVKPILRPLSDLTKEIEHKGERFVPIEWFEIGDDENTSMEYDHGNIKLVKTLDYIAKYNIHNDINYLPYGVAQKLFEWHLDVFGLIDKGLAIDINTLKQ